MPSLFLLYPCYLSRNQNTLDDHSDFGKWRISILCRAKRKERSTEEECLSFIILHRTSVFFDSTIPIKNSLDVSNDHMVKNKSGFYASLGPRFWENNPISPLLTYFLAPLLSGYSVQWKISRKGRNFFGEWLLCYIVVDHCQLTPRMSITVSDDNGVVFHRQNNTNLY